jgi:hypothetical protein
VADYILKNGGERKTFEGSGKPGRQLQWLIKILWLTDKCVNIPKSSKDLKGIEFTGAAFLSRF